MTRPRIALVEVGTPSTHIYSMAHLPRVGIPTMGAMLRDRGYECDIWFQSMSEVKDEQFKGYGIVGIGSLTNTIGEAYRLADYCRKDGATVVMGGPHVTFSPEEALEHCDYVVIGEGEVPFPALVDALAGGGAPEEVKGIAYRLSSGEVKRTGPADLADFESLPAPDFSLSPQVRETEAPPIVMTSRGCPHDCTFCSVTAMFGKKYRFRTNDQVIEELRPFLHRSVCFGDDNFCAKPSRTRALLQEMIDRDAVPLRWAGQMCVGAARDDEMLELMRKTRCRIMYVGIESIEADTLEQFGKAHQVDAVEECIERLHAHDIGIHGMFVVGMDDDTGTVTRMVDYAIEKDIDTIQICSLTPFPGTGVYRDSADRLLHRDWKYFDGMHVVVNRRNGSPYEIQMAIVRELQRFYSLRRVARSYRRGRAWRVKYRAGGNVLMRRWVKENRDYLERLKGYAAS